MKKICIMITVALFCMGTAHGADRCAPCEKPAKPACVAPCDDCYDHNASDRPFDFFKTRKDCDACRKPKCEKPKVKEKCIPCKPKVKKVPKCPPCKPVKKPACARPCDDCYDHNASDRPFDFFKTRKSCDACKCEKPKVKKECVPCKPKVKKVRECKPCKVECKPCKVKCKPKPKKVCKPCWRK